MLGTIILTILIVAGLAIIIFRLMVFRGGIGVQIIDPQTFLIEPPEQFNEVVQLPNGTSQVNWQQKGAIQIEAQPLPDGPLRPLSRLNGETCFLHQSPEPLQRETYRVTFKNGETETIGQRFWPLPGVTNLRDLGGYKTADGRYTAWGKIFRTGHMGGATHESLNILSDYGINMICDLRSLRDRKSVV